MGFPLLLALASIMCCPKSLEHTIHVPAVSNTEVVMNPGWWREAAFNTSTFMELVLMVGAVKEVLRANHGPSAKSLAPLGKPASVPQLSIFKCDHLT